MSGQDAEKALLEAVHAYHEATGNPVRLEIETACGAISLTTTYEAPKGHWPACEGEWRRETCEDRGLHPTERCEACAPQCHGDCHTCDLTETCADAWESAV